MKQYTSMQPAAAPRTFSNKRLCPRCDAPLRPRRYRNVLVDRCGRCGGAFFEPGESNRALGPNADVVDWTQGKDVTALGVSGKYCPCRGHRMEGYRVAFQDERLDVDVCLHCRGVWLDRHEARQLKIVIHARRAAAGEAPAIGRGMAWLNAFAGVPIEEHHPVWRSAHWVLLLILLLVAVYVAEIALVDEARIDEFARGFALIPAHVLNSGAWWTLLTHMLVHASVFDLAAVLVFLKIFGDNVEDKLGGRKLFKIFLSAGLLGALVHVLAHPLSEIPILGAGTAVSGLLGAYVVLFPRVRIWGFFAVRLSALSFALIWVLTQSVAASIVWVELFPTSVPWLAHLAGFATGAALALRYRAQRMRWLAQRRAEVRVGARRST